MIHRLTYMKFDIFRSVTNFVYIAVTYSRTIYSFNLSYFKYSYQQTTTVDVDITD